MNSATACCIFFVLVFHSELAVLKKAEPISAAICAGSLSALLGDLLSSRRLAAAEFDLRSSLIQGGIEGSSLDLESIRPARRGASVARSLIWLESFFRAFCFASACAWFNSHPTAAWMSFPDSARPSRAFSAGKPMSTSSATPRSREFDGGAADSGGLLEACGAGDFGFGRSVTGFPNNPKTSSSVSGTVEGCAVGLRSCICPKPKGSLSSPIKSAIAPLEELLVAGGVPPR